MSAATAGKLAYLVGHVTSLREGLRVGTLSPEDVDRQLRRLQHGSVTVERAARSYLESGVSDNQRRKCVAWLAGPAAPLAGVELDALDGPCCERWLSSAPMRRLAPGSVSTYWRVLRSVVRHAAARGWIARTPWGPWRPRVRAAAYAPGRVAREAARDVGELGAVLLAAAALDQRRARAGMLPDVAAKCACVALLGVRQGELSGLRWPDVDPAACVVRVRSTKQGHVRELRADPVLFELLGRYRAALAARDLLTDEGPVFPSATSSTPGRPRPYEGRTDCLGSDVLRAVVEAAGLPHPERWSATSLRDTFATLEAQGHGGDLEAVRQRTRHASIASLVRYLRSRGREPAAPGFTLPAAPPRRALPR